MPDDNPLDYLGNLIEVGDRVLYSTKTRESNFGDGIVEEVYQKDKTQYRRERNATGMWISVPEVTQEWWVKVRTKCRIWDRTAVDYVDGSTTKRLNDLRRFVVVEKA